MYKLCLSFCCLFLVLQANAQERKWQYRIGLDAFVTDLVNIEEVPSATMQVKNYGAVIPHVQVGRQLNDKWNITAGVGFIRHKSAFRFEYTDIPLVNHLEYLAVPMGVQYKLKNWGGNKSWHLESSIWNKLLVYHESNLPDMMRDPIYVYPRFNWYVINLRLATGVAWALRNEHSFSVTGFVSRDITAYLNKYSFLDYLQPSRYLFGGIGLSYSF
ncbi:MAG: hypothetical protein JNM21_13065 [Taibaiella sp.]|nr:hypothetical protein [Taibaiella sp.]